jgi:hypothetical protein
VAGCVLQPQGCVRYTRKTCAWDLSAFCALQNKVFMAIPNRKNDFVLHILITCTVVVLLWAMHTIIFELSAQGH